MRLSTKGRYAVMAMTDLAAHEGRAGARGAVCLAEIAQRQQISLPYLEQLFSRLRRKGVVESVRGPGGGYRLAKGADVTSIAEIVRAVDEPLKAVRCSGEEKLGCLKGGRRCATHALWDAMGRKIEGFLAGISLADVLAGNFDREAA